MVVSKHLSYVQGVKYLGYSFYVMKGKCLLTVHAKAKAKMKAKLKELTSRSNGWGRNFFFLSFKEQTDHSANDYEKVASDSIVKVPLHL